MPTTSNPPVERATPRATSVPFCGVPTAVHTQPEETEQHLVALTSIGSKHLAMSSLMTPFAAAAMAPMSHTPSHPPGHWPVSGSFVAMPLPVTDVHGHEFAAQHTWSMFKPTAAGL